MRSISKNEEKAIAAVNRIYNSCSSNLSSGKYRIVEVDIKEIKAVWTSVNTSSVRTVIKDERVDSLQNQGLPYCYTFDVFDSSTKDLSDLRDLLISHPGCAVSIQLIPTSYTFEEDSSITEYRQLLDSLSKSIMTLGAQAALVFCQQNLLLISIGIIKLIREAHYLNIIF